MTDTRIRIGAGVAYPLLSGGWMCTRPGDAFPVWRENEYEAGRLLRSWLPPLDVPPAVDSLTHPGRRSATSGGAGSDRLDDTRGVVPASRAPGSTVSPPEMIPADPGATSYSRPAVAVGMAGRADHTENGAAA